MIILVDGQYVDNKTGEVLDSKEWIIHQFGGKITKVKRISDKQLAFIKALESKLGYKVSNHSNMPAFKASKTIERLKGLVEKRGL